MKLHYALLLIGLTLSGVLTLPARPKDDAEVVKSEAEPAFRDFTGTIDTGSGYPFLNAHPAPFSPGFFNNFDDIFRRFRAHLWPIVADSDEANAGSGDSDEIGFGFRPLIPVTLNNENATKTSTVKVVNGHKVEINETTYGDESSGLFKVRVVNVRPLESGEEVSQGETNNQGDYKPMAAPSTLSPPPARRSELDESDEREDGRREPLLKQSKDNEVRDIDEPQSTTTTTTSSSIAGNKDDSLADSTDNSKTTVMADLLAQMQLEQQQQQLVAAQDANTMAHNEQAEMLETDIEPEAEFLEAIQNDDDDDDVEHATKEREELESDADDADDALVVPVVVMSDTFNEEWSEQAQPEDANDLSNDIESHEGRIPIDLSNDIAVNDWAAANANFEPNPDAELIEVAVKPLKAMPKFEKLSLK
ncbi:vir-1 [Drosophila busckii]|uniref:Vir-1 n=1 Tax=Drosophila busckii TaxID=30019 RepID=A0A0M5IY25_DROBS|nr:vir-1 [Drosophila busckii]